MKLRDALATLGVGVAYRFIKLGRRNSRRGGRVHRRASLRLGQILRYAWEIRSEEILETVMGEIGDTVVIGPFKGMRIGQQSSWGEGLMLPKLIGAYEPQLFPALEELKQVEFESVIDVGAAEGFYAVGAALSLRTRKVIAVDTDESALSATRANAELNGVGDKLQVRSRIDVRDLCELVDPASCHLVISDCEGFELELFTPEVVEALRSSYCIIECHDFLGRAVAGPLEQLFAGTHEVAVIQAGAGEVPAHESLHTLPSIERSLAVHQPHPASMSWLFVRPSGRGRK